MLLFYFDHNVSSLMAQARQYPVKRPAGFHWDFFLLGITTFISGILGLPAPNGLVPQAPVNSESLSVLNRIDHEYKDTEGIVPMEDYHTWKERTQKDRSRMEHKVVRTALVEQRVSHFAIGLLTVGTMTRPLLVCLGLMPRALFAGVFLVVGWGSIEGNGITHKTLFLLRDPKMTPREHILLTIPRRKTFLFVLIQWLFFAMTFGISQTKGKAFFPSVERSRNAQAEMIALPSCRRYRIPCHHHGSHSSALLLWTQMVQPRRAGHSRRSHRQQSCRHGFHRIRPGTRHWRRSRGCTRHGNCWHQAQGARRKRGGGRRRADDAATTNVAHP